MKLQEGWVVMVRKMLSINIINMTSCISYYNENMNDI